ncbi:MAG: amino acid ABC transporter substrate-binding protein, partial [Pseudomonadota bacterium]
KVYDYFSARNGVYSSVVFSSPAQVIEGLGDGKCDVALFNSALVPEVLTELNAKDAHIVLPEMVE